jgi:RNA polymerase sigma-70 factor, ECF subfamily
MYPGALGSTRTGQPVLETECGSKLKMATIKIQMSERMTTLSQATPTETAYENGLIQRVKDGDHNLFYELIKPYERRLYATALAILRNEADAEDIAQDAVLKAFRHLSQFRGDSKFSTWLIQITVNEARMRRRRMTTRTMESIDDQKANDEDYVPREFADWREIPSESLERQEIRNALAQAVSALGEKYRAVFVLRDIEHLSIEETAKVLDIAPSSVKTRLLRARLMLRDFLSPGFNGHWTSKLAFAKGNKPWE